MQADWRQDVKLLNRQYEAKMRVLQENILSFVSPSSFAPTIQRLHSILLDRSVVTRPKTWADIQTHHHVKCAQFLSYWRHSGDSYIFDATKSVCGSLQYAHKSYTKSKCRRGTNYQRKNAGTQLTIQIKKHGKIFQLSIWIWPVRDSVTTYRLQLIWTLILPRHSKKRKWEFFLNMLCPE